MTRTMTVIVLALISILVARESARAQGVQATLLVTQAAKQEHAKLQRLFRASDRAAEAAERRCKPVAALAPGLRGALARKDVRAIVSTAQRIVDGERACRGAWAGFSTARGKVESWLFGLFDLMPAPPQAGAMSLADRALVGDLAHLAGVVTERLQHPLYKRAVEAAAGALAAMMTVAEAGHWLQKNAPRR